MKVRLYLSLLLIIFPLFSLLFAQSQDRWVNLVTIDGPIGPITSSIIIKAINQSVIDSAEALVIELNTPGGLDEPMRDIITEILNSEVPVIVYVSPAGSRAASAGAFITLSGHIAAMAPGTNIGAAHPVGAGGKEIDKTMSAKVINDMVAQAKSVAEKRGRNAKWVEDAIRESVSVTETEALEENIIDLIAVDTDDLIKKLNGRELKDRGSLNDWYFFEYSQDSRAQEAHYYHLSALGRLSDRSPCSDAWH